MRIPVQHNNGQPLYRQIQRFLREQIESQAIQPGTRLPATRELAHSLGVSRITVVNAYTELEAEGLIYTERGNGTFAADPPSIPASNGKAEPTDWPQWQMQLRQREPLALIEAPNIQFTHPDLISFDKGIGTAQLFPADDFRKTLQTVMRRDGVNALDYGDEFSGGYPSLKATIAHILSSQGIPTQADNVLITSGSQQALTLIAHLLLRPGDVVLVENPTYTGAIELFRSVDARIVGIPLDDDGMRLDHLEHAMRTWHPKLIYTIPTFHNPTGTSLSGVRRRELIASARHNNVPIVEDDFVGDLRYEGRAQPALKALDPDGNVIYVNTFSKALAPALRIGYLVASGPVYDALLQFKRINDRDTSDLLQRALEAFISVGRYQSHLRRVTRVYRERRDAMCDALNRYLPGNVTWQRPHGGLFIWLRLSDHIDTRKLLPIAQQLGVTFSPGAMFFPGNDAPCNYLRLNFSFYKPDRIDEGVQRLANAIGQLK